MKKNALASKSGGQVYVMSQFKYENPDCVRARLAQKLVNGVITYCGYHMIVSDGTGGTFRAELEERGADVSEQIPGMGPDRRRLMRLVHQEMRDLDVALWTEEKPSLMWDAYLINEPIMKGDADLVIPARTEGGWRSHPTEQVHIEKYCNEAFRAFTGVSIDCWFGPFAANKRALGYFIKHAEDGTDDKWMSIHGPRVDIIAADLRVKSVEVPRYRYDADQRREEEGNHALILKRAEQVANLVPALHARAKRLGLIG